MSENTKEILGGIGCCLVFVLLILFGVFLFSYGITGLWGLR